MAAEVRHAREHDWSLASVLAAFAGELRAGVTVSPAESADALAALRALPVLERTRFKAALRACMAKTPADRERFDAVFKAFWREQAVVPEPAAESDNADNANEPANDAEQGGGPAPARAQATDQNSDEALDDDTNAGASAERRAMSRDLAAIDDLERAAMERLIRTLGHQLARRASRRWRQRARGWICARACAPRSRAAGKYSSSGAGIVRASDRGWWCLPT